MAIAIKLFKTKSQFKNLLKRQVQKTAVEEDYEQYLKEQDDLNKLAMKT
jgi:hypothetical protein